MRTIRIAFFFLILLSGKAFATHNRAGEITYKQISALQYEFTLTTFTDVSNPGNADRPTAILNFGDGTTKEEPRVERVLVGQFIQRNRYRFLHTFPGYATYIISYQDPNRNNNVQNMINSLNTPFYVETELVINPFIGFNNSPVLLLEPIDFGGLNKLFVHNPNAYDQDGDSLSFKLVPCKQDVGLDVFGFQIPDVANGFASNRFEIDAETGQLEWENPIQLGLYNIAIQVEEWRFIVNTKKYQRIGYIVRDMQIEIVNTNNRPPVITPIKDTCVLAGTTLNQIIQARDLDNNNITLTATGGPFELNSPDTIFFPQPSTATGFIQQNFQWRSSCNAVRKQPYQIVFKVVDNGIPAPKLVDLEAWQVRVISPAPQNLNAEALGNGINLTWNALNCGRASGYLIYRRNGSNPYTPTLCETGISSDKGYELIATINSISTTTFRDDNRGAGLSIGNSYCYRIVATFPDGAQSLASNESCSILSRDLPAITLASILTTNSTSGSDSVMFSPPTELDTLQFTGPYIFNWQRASSTNPTFQTVKSTQVTMLGDLTDTVLKELNLNTEAEQYRYRIQLFANGTEVGFSKVASSIFLSVPNSENRTVNLSWDVSAPWANDSFIVYRFNTSTGIFDSIATTLVTNFIDTGLVDGREYCYYVKSIGKYSGGGFPEPIINFSQQICATPTDTELPCIGPLVVVPSCDLFRNELSWTTDSPCMGDVIKYRLYKAKFENSDFQLLAELSPKSVNSFSDINLFESIAGCYFITSVDSFDNESAASNRVCVDNCPVLELPNVFTPNNDGKNDLFMPFTDSVAFVSEVQVSIFNRYGKLVFKTNDPQINWDGKDQNNKEDLPVGTYFYAIQFSEIRVTGLKPRTRTGFIELIR